MFKQELVKHLAKRIPSCTKRQVQDVLETLGKYIIYTVKYNPNETIPIPKIGRFEVTHIPERKGVSNLFGDWWTVPAHDELKFNFIEHVRLLEDIDGICDWKHVDPDELLNDTQEEIKLVKIVKPNKPLESMSAAELLNYINAMQYIDYDGDGIL